MFECVQHLGKYRKNDNINIEAKKVTNGFLKFKKGLVHDAKHVYKNNL